MGYVIGTLIAGTVSGFARVTGLDRERSFFSAVLIVVGHYYVLFAAMAGSMDALRIEMIGLGVFATWAVIGFKRSHLIVAAGLVAHGIFDFFHAGLVNNPGVPVWWPAFCGAFDVVAGALLALMGQRAVPGVR